MRRTPADDWGPTHGADPEPVERPATVRKGTIPRLVNYFADNLPRDAWGRLNTPVNVGALSTGLRKLIDAGHTEAQIRAMMEVFIADIQRTPLPQHVAPWRGFLANLDALASRATTPTTESYDDLQTDRRI